VLNLCHLLVCPQGEITRIIPHRATGRADYFGPPVNRAARFLAASAPGQILAERCLVEECVQFWSADELVGNRLADALQVLEPAESGC
jgi:hypothetical protein